MYMRIFILIIMVILLSGCYSGWVRYECQEYKNWDKPQCKPPQCVAEGLCTKDLYDTDTWEEVQKYAK